MNTKYLTIASACLLLSFTGCSKKQTSVYITTSDGAYFIPQQEITIEAKKANSSVNINPEKKLQTIEGFGACFNELGWQALSALDENTQDSIFQNLFAPDKGAAFTYNRMPIGANDFAIDWYSFNETPNDFEMKNFSIQNDHKTLIPFIKKALAYNPEMKIWASPWCPPSWMKYNGHYASKPNDPTKPYYNGLPEARRGFEGTDMFIQKPEYLEAYALYFKKFIESYKKEGIQIAAVAPQNEFNSVQPYPSCTWTSKGLNEFIGKYLGPAMKEVGVPVWFGTMERENYKLVDTLLTDPSSSKYIQCVAFQWAGKGAIGEIHQRYPEMKLIQSESECGNGLNDWKHAMHTWDLLKHYLKNGASIYEYWNIALEKDGMSRWGWRQNSLISVDSSNKTYTYNPEYYIMQHFSRYVKPGAVMLETDGEYDNLVAFMNPDNTIAIIIANQTAEDKQVDINIGEKSISPVLAKSTVNTIVLSL